MRRVLFLDLECSLQMLKFAGKNNDCPVSLTMKLASRRVCLVS